MISWKMILVGIAGLYIGYRLNQVANERSEKRIIDALTAQIEALKGKVQQGRISSEEQSKLSGLEEALRIIQTK